MSEFSELRETAKARQDAGWRTMDGMSIKVLLAIIADAERYQWLRDYHIGDDPESINLDSARKPGLDAAIDAAK